MFFSGVVRLWLVDLLASTLKTYPRNDGQWTVTGLTAHEDEVSVAPIEAVTLSLGDVRAGAQR